MTAPKHDPDIAKMFQLAGAKIEEADDMTYAMADHLLMQERGNVEAAARKLRAILIRKMGL